MVAIARPGPSGRPPPIIALMNAADGQPTRIAIADDSQIIRDLIDEIVRYIPGFELAASFDNGPAMVAWVRDGGTADVFVIDMRLPGLSGTATISALRRYDDKARVLAFSASDQAESVRAATNAGADDYLLKESTLDNLLAAITGECPSPATDEPAGTTAGDAAVPAPGEGEGLTVLVVDDHDLVRDAVAAMLESRGFRVATCASAAETRDWVDSGRHCDAALIDLRLGDAPGASLIADFQRHLPKVALLVHSGAADEDGARVARETGADGFLAKGEYTIDEMVGELTAAISRRSNA